MAGQPPPASLVGNAFVSQYYNVLHQSPHVVHRFYTDESKLSRAEAGPNGAVDTVVSQAGIHQKVMSMDYGDIRAEIKTVDSQQSLNGSVLVMVTGSLSSQSRANKRNFVQTFFLAPQEKGYFVLNDMFRYMDGELQPVQPLDSMANGTPDLNPTPEIPNQGIADSQLLQQQEVRDYSSSTVEEAIPSEDHYQIAEEEIPEVEVPPAEEVIPAHQDMSVPASEEQLPPEEVNPEDAPKKSYASILRVRNDTSGALVSASQTTVQKATPAQVDRVISSSQVSQGASPSLVSDKQDEGTAADLEGDGQSVYVRNLPLDISSSELETEFQKFGLITPGGVDLRNQRAGICYAFIEFEESSSAQNAREASPIWIHGRPVYVDEKRPMPMAPRGARGRRTYQGDGMRGRGYFGGRGSGRSIGQDFERDFNTKGRGTGIGRGSYGGHAYVSNNYGSSFNTVNGYRKADSQGGTGLRPVRRGAGNQVERGRESAAE